MRSGTSRRSSRSISGSKAPVQAVGLRPRAPAELEHVAEARVVMSPTFAMLALEQRVGGGGRAVHDRRRAPRARRRSASSAASTPNAWLSGVVGTLARRTSPLAASTRDQVGEGAADVDASDLLMAPRWCSASRLRTRSYAILGAHGGVGRQLGHRAGEADLALLDDVGAVGDTSAAKCRFCSRQQHRQPLASSARGSRRAIWSTITGASPSDGSSSRTQRGLPISVRAMVSICCSPPDMRPPGRSRMLGEIGEQREQPLRRPGRRARARRLAADLEVLHHRELGEDAPVLRARNRGRAARSRRAASRSMRRPSKRDLARAPAAPGP